MTTDICGIRKILVGLLVAAVASALAAGGIAAGPAAAGDGGDGRFLALCVGLKYPGTRDALQYSTDDVRKIAAAFRRTSGFDAERSTIEALVDDEFDSPKPTVREVTRRLGAMAAEAGPGDRLVFYFSGHGLLGKDNHSILVCAGGSDQRDDAGHLYLSQVRNILASSAAAAKLVIIDACHSGGKSADAGDLTPDSVALSLGDAGGKGGGDPSLAWLVSSGADEKSWEDPDSGQGLFTRYLLECLGPVGELADVNYDGILSLAEIHQHVAGGITAFLRERTLKRDAAWRGRRQMPRVGVGGITDPDATTLARMKLFYYDQGDGGDAVPERPDEAEWTDARSIGQAGLPISLSLVNAANDERIDIGEILRRRSEANGAFLPENAGRMRADDWMTGSDRGTAVRLGYSRRLLGHELILNAPRNETEAMNWYHFRIVETNNRVISTKAQRDPQWAYECGEYYRLGVNVPKNLATAVKWYQRAADSGHPGAQFEMGQAYELGHGVGVNRAEAKKWYEKAANLGHMHAKYKTIVLSENQGASASR